MQTEDTVETNSKNGIFSIFHHAVILTFNLSTPKPNQFTFIPRCITNKILANICHCIPQISWKQHTGWMHGHMHGCTVDKNIIPIAPSYQVTMEA